MKLTIEQEKAKKHFNGPALVLAVPGAGKTTVLLNRIIYLIEEKKIKPEKILSLTFSKSQAVDMKERFKEMAKDMDIRQFPMFSTIHAFSYYIIRYYLKINHRKLTVIEGSNEYNKYNVVRK
ncbi:MAG: UvrD-helicase domain-containing protein, partial [Tissierellia bacterium]|nr:UvrD-helicase domain-containing protein [Tissierellia bacterium]